MIHNSANGKNYVGSSRHVEYRMKTHLSNLRHGKHYNKPMQNDFDTYGEEYFSFRPLFEVSEEVRLTSAECFVMKILRSQDHDFGYNRDNYGTSKGATRDSLRNMHFAYMERCFPRAYAYKGKVV